LLLTVGSFGCTGQDVTGAWRGPFPLEEATDCRIRITYERRFDLSCQNDEWLGGGRWSQDGAVLTFRFESLSRRKARLNGEIPSVELAFEGHGNMMRLGDARGAEKPMEWHRLGG